MMSMVIADSYMVRARFLPGFLTALPLVAVSLALFDVARIQLSQVGLAIFAILGVYVIADLGRRRGKRIESEIYYRAGGKPSAKMLLPDDDTFGTETKIRYWEFLSRKTGLPQPALHATLEAWLDFSEACGAWLRENTRDTKIFNILFAENVTYGFRRNLLGLKPTALALNILVALLVALWISYDWYFGEASFDLPGIYFLAPTLAAHLFFFIFYVTWDTTIAAAKAYGRQLILSCETLMSQENEHHLQKPRLAQNAY